MKMFTYVNFAGRRCAEAFHFYEQHLGARVGMLMTHGQAPDQRDRFGVNWMILHERPAR